MNTTEKARLITEALKKEYPLAECTLDYDQAYRLLIAVRLAAQCTDARVNLVTPVLFERFPTLDSLADAPVEAVEEIVRSCGFYKHKAQDIVGMCAMLRDVYGGRVPDTMEELLKLPGVGRKTANLILGDVFHKPAYVCDTHCIRITNLLGLTHSKDPARVEQELRACLDPAEASDFCHRMVMHGRAVCVARRPACGQCVLAPWCDEAARRAQLPSD